MSHDQSVMDPDPHLERVEFLARLITADWLEEWCNNHRFDLPAQSSAMRACQAAINAWGFDYSQSWVNGLVCEAKHLAFNRLHPDTQEFLLERHPELDAEVRSNTRQLAIAL